MIKPLPEEYFTHSIKSDQVFCPLTVNPCTPDCILWSQTEAFKEKDEKGNLLITYDGECMLRNGLDSLHRLQFKKF